MIGTMIVIEADGRRSERALRNTPPLADLQRAVGGDLQLVPAFRRVAHASGMQKCFVLCNEHGKYMNLPINLEANRLWQLSAGEPLDDILVGPVVILFGDAEFMAAL